MLVSRVTTVNDIEEIVTTATNNFTNILSTYDIKSKYPELFWGGNGVGDRWANKRFNYSVIKSNKSTSLYSENEDDTIPEQLLAAFLENNKGTFSKRAKENEFASLTIAEIKEIESRFKLYFEI